MPDDLAYRLVTGTTSTLPNSFRPHLIPGASNVEDLLPTDLSRNEYVSAVSGSAIVPRD
jgi:hypothetical protein